MTLLLVLALAALALAVGLALRAVAAGSAPAQRTIAQIGGYGFEQPERRTRSRRSLQERLDVLAAAVGAAVNRHMPREREEALRRRLYSAGMYETSPRKFIGYRVIAAGVLGFACLWLVLAAGKSGAAVLIAVAAAFFGWFLPSFVLGRRATHRLQRIDHDMPELVDLLVTCVEGGLGLTAALQLVSRGGGPLRQEVRLMLREQSMGLTGREALENLLNRADTLSVRAFVQALVQGESLGVSIGKTLRDLATEMRKRRRAAAEERAHKAATKIIFPLVLLILPSIFVVTLGPTLIELARLLGNG